MAYPAIPPGSRSRPGTVTAAAAFFFVAAGALAVLSVVEFTAVVPAGEAAERLYRDTPDEGFGTAFAAVLFGGAGVLDLLFAVALAVIAAFVLRGKRPARVMSWIVGSLALLCCGCGSAVYSGALFENLPAGPSGTDGPSNEELVAEMFDAVPSWFVAAVLLLVAVLILSLLVAMILLMVAPSNAYFRKEPETWVPPTDWYGGYPGGRPDYPTGPVLPPPPAAPGQYPPPPQGQYPPPPQGQYPPPPQGQYPPPPA